MRIALDIRPLARHTWTGMERYVYHLAVALARVLEPGDSLTRYAVSFGQRRRLREVADRRLDAGRQGATRIFPLPAEPISRATRGGALPGLDLLLGRPDVVHITDGPALVPRRAAQVATVFDLTPRLFPDQFSPAARAKFQAYFELVRTRARQVIAISDSVRSDLERHLGIPPARISVTPLAPDPRFRPIDDPIRIRAVLARHRVSRPYFIYVGTLGPRKNLATLLRAFSRLELRHRRDVHLVLCGKPTPHAEELRRLARELRIDPSVTFTGYLPFDDLHLLLSGAEGLVLPSLYEGFGLPVLEAMACGVPVIASRVASIPEVAGEAALLEDPQSPDGFARAMVTLLEDSGRRRELRRLGLERAGTRTWELTARATLLAYRNACEAGP